MPNLQLINQIQNFTGQETQEEVNAALDKAAIGFNPLKQKDSSKMTALMHACDKHHLKSVKYLLNKSKSSYLDSCLINDKDGKGKTALHYAVKFKDFSEEKLAQPEDQNKLNDNREILSLLQQHGASVPVWNVKYGQVNHIMIDASEAGNLKFLREHTAETNHFMNLMKFRDRHHSTHHYYPGNSIYLDYCLRAGIKGGIEILKFWAAHPLKNESVGSSAKLQEILKQAANKNPEIYNFVLQELLAYPKLGLKVNDAKHLDMIADYLDIQNNLEKFLEDLTYLQATLLLSYATKTANCEIINKFVTAILHKIPEGKQPNEKISLAFANAAALRADRRMVEILLPLGPFDQASVNVAFIHAARRGDIELTKILLKHRPDYSLDANLIPQNAGVDDEDLPKIYNERVTSLLHAIHFIKLADQGKARETFQDVAVEDREALLAFCASMNPTAKQLCRQLMSEVGLIALQQEGAPDSDNENEPAANEAKEENVNAIQNPPAYDASAEPGQVVNINKLGIFAGSSINQVDADKQLKEEHAQDAVSSPISLVYN